jgi:hypothetical protein
MLRIFKKITKNGSIFSKMLYFLKFLKIMLKISFKFYCSFYIPRNFIKKDAKSCKISKVSPKKLQIGQRTKIQKHQSTPSPPYFTIHGLKAEQILFIDFKGKSTLLDS